MATVGAVLSVLLVVVISLCSGMLLVLLVGLVRAAALHSRSGSFPAFLLIQARWVRGVAIYGRSNLEWRRSYSLRVAPDVVLPRRSIDITGAPSEWHGVGLVVVQLLVGGTPFLLALQPGDASGMISWIDSAPPGG